MKHVRSTKTRAFTITEILVVVVIIIILMGMLIPIISAIKANAKKTECTSHLHQIGQACHAYASDHADYLPRSGLYQIDFEPNQGEATVWFNAIQFRRPRMR